MTVLCPGKVETRSEGEVTSTWDVKWVGDGKEVEKNTTFPIFN